MNFSHNIFKIINVSPAISSNPEARLAEWFSLLGNPARLQILLLLGEGEACVCHLKQALGQRQAYISQQLMILRKAGIVSTSRKGRNVYYCLARPEVLELVHAAATILGIELSLPDMKAVPGCPFPVETA